MYGAFSKLFRIGIWLFHFPFVVFFVLSRFCLSVIGVLWRTFSFRGFCQLGYLGSTNWEPPTRNTTTPVSIISKHCLWKRDLSDNSIHFFSSFDSDILFFLDALSLFHIVPYRNLTVWFFICCLFLCYLNSVYQLLGSYRSLFLVPDSVKWAFLRPQTESLLLEPRGFLFPSSANLVCRRETCPEAIFTFFFLLLTHTFCFLDSLSLFLVAPYRNLTVWFSICFRFVLFWFHMSVFGVL